MQTHPDGAGAVPDELFERPVHPLPLPGADAWWRPLLFVESSSSCKFTDDNTFPNDPMTSSWSVPWFDKLWFIIPLLLLVVVAVVVVLLLDAVAAVVLLLFTQSNPDGGISFCKKTKVR